MAVAFDATVSVRGFGVTSLTTASFTIAGSDRAAQLQLSGDIVGSSGFSGSVGGASGAAISNADATDQNTSLRVLCFGVTAPAAGSQTGTMSWTGSAADVTLGVITATGVDQTTSLNNGNGGLWMYQNVVVAIPATQSFALQCQWGTSGQVAAIALTNPTQFRATLFNQARVAVPIA